MRPNQDGGINEQPVEVTDPDRGTVLRLRRIEGRWFAKTRDGDRTLARLTNLPAKIKAVQLADLDLGCASR